MDKEINNNDCDYIDLNLPSGTLWATMNVGASKPSDCGLYFQWGDTQGYTADQVGAGDGQKYFGLEDYKWMTDGSVPNDVSVSIFSKYNKEGETLELEDDAAHVHMSGDWHMPTAKQLQELIDNTTTAWAISDGVSGMTFTSKKDTSKFIFFPAAGHALYGSVNSSGNNGYVWSSMLSANYVICGQHLGFKPGGAYLINIHRGYGFPVRGVIG